MKPIKYPNVIEVIEYDHDGNRRVTKYYREDIFVHVKWAIEKVLKGADNDETN